MANQEYLNNYVIWRGDISFKQSPFNDVDAMILAQLSSNNYGGLVPGAAHADELLPSPYKACPLLKEVAAAYEKKALRSKAYEELEAGERLLILAGKSSRFASLRMDGYVDDTSPTEVKQFSAVTFRFSKYKSFIAYRGTDGSVISWKENFNMIYMMPIPAQTDATTYLKIMGQGFFNSVMVAGHSKGGNMALYAATFCGRKIQDNLTAIYCFDAPGYMRNFSDSPEYSRIADRVISYMPVGSTIGTILDKPYGSTIIESQGVGIEQHDMENWIVKGTTFVKAEHTNAYSQNMDAVIQRNIDKLSLDQRPGFIADFFGILENNDIEHILDFTTLDMKKIWGLFKSASTMPAANRAIALAFVKDLWDVTRKY